MLLLGLLTSIALATHEDCHEACAGEHPGSFVLLQKGSALAPIFGPDSTPGAQLPFNSIVGDAKAKTKAQVQVEASPSVDSTKVKVSTPDAKLTNAFNTKAGARKVALVQAKPRTTDVKSLAQESTHAVRAIKSKGIKVFGMTQICVLLMVIVLVTLARHFTALFNRVWSTRQEPLEAAATSNSPATRPALILFQGFVYICFSGGLIKYNQFLMSDGNFPFTVNLTLGHSGTGFIFLFVCRAVKPALFPSLQNPEMRQTFGVGYLCKSVGPIAACFSASLVLSNLAYKYCSVAFLQMMKEGNVMIVYVLSLACGSESFDGVRARILLCILFSTSMAVEGEMSFDLEGFSIQAGSQLCECAKVVMQAALLCAASRPKLDPLTFSLFLQLATFCCIGVVLILTMTVAPFTETASRADYVAWWPHLLLNASVALGLNTSIAFFVSNTSGIAAILLGIVKDIFIVFIDVVISGTPVSPLQIAAFSLQTCFLCAYSMFKLFPEQSGDQAPKVSKQDQSNETGKANANA